MAQHYNIVTNYKINQIFKSGSKYFKLNLGLSSTSPNSAGDRVFNDKDDFAFFYNTTYQTTIQAQGSIGNIKFYTDHYIKLDQIAFYYDKEEFIFEFDYKMVSDKGVDFYLGHIIKNIEIEYEDRKSKEELQKEELKKEVGVAEKIFMNPGQVNYSDLKVYLDKINAERLNIKK